MKPFYKSLVDYCRRYRAFFSCLYHVIKKKRVCLEYFCLFIQHIILQVFFTYFLWPSAAKSVEFLIFQRQKPFEIDFDFSFFFAPQTRVKEHLFSGSFFILQPIDLDFYYLCLLSIIAIMYSSHIKRNQVSSTYLQKLLLHTSQDSFYKWIKVSSHGIDIFGLKVVVKSVLGKIILNFTKPLQSCCKKICPERINWPDRLAGISEGAQ